MTTGTQPAIAIKNRQISGKWTFAICAVLLVLFGTLSFSASSKSERDDEPMHLVGGYVHRYLQDYRINFEDPALFGMWAAPPLPNTAILVETQHPIWSNIPTEPISSGCSRFHAVPHSGELAGFDAQRVPVAVHVRRRRAGRRWRAWWSWRFAGSVGAIATTFLFALDPNLAAHASLVKNDVVDRIADGGAWLFVVAIRPRGSIWRLVSSRSCSGAAVNTNSPACCSVRSHCCCWLCGRSSRDAAWRSGHHARNIWDRLAAVTS